MQPPLPSLPATGDAGLDHAHAQLQQAIHALAHAPAAAQPAALAALRAELAAHFAQEDAELLRLGRTENACHLDEHAAVLRSADEVAAALAAGDPAVVRRFARALAGWLPAHVAEMDLRLARQLFRQRTGGAPLQLVRPLRPAPTVRNPDLESLPC